MELRTPRTQLIAAIVTAAVLALVAVNVTAVQQCDTRDYTVYADSSTPVVTCFNTPGVYHMTVHGQWSYGPDVAECGWVHANGAWHDNQYTFMINGGPVHPDWEEMNDCGPLSDHHLYNFDFIHMNGFMTLQIRDSHYEDNSGSVAVHIGGGS